MNKRMNEVQKSRPLRNSLRICKWCLGEDFTKGTQKGLAYGKKADTIVSALEENYFRSALEPPNGVTGRPCSEGGRSSALGAPEHRRRTVPQNEGTGWGLALPSAAGGPESPCLQHGASRLQLRRSC